MFYTRSWYDRLPQALVTLVNVEPHEVVQVLSAPRRLPLAATSEGVRFLTISVRTKAGRPLIVAVRKVGDFDQQIIGARQMTPTELARFEAWEASA